MEMERDSFISHGATAILRDRLCDSSDAYEAIICANCQTFAILNATTGENICRNQACKAKGDFRKVVIPYGFKLLVHLLWAAGLHMKLRLQ